MFNRKIIMVIAAAATMFLATAIEPASAFGGFNRGHMHGAVPPVHELSPYVPVEPAPGQAGDHQLEQAGSFDIWQPAGEHVGVAR
jgi:hypothetical protein